MSQPGYTGTPLIELSGSQAGRRRRPDHHGLGRHVRGLDIDGFALGAGILITGSAATGNRIEANYIGTDPTGSQALPNYFGVQILDGASNNLVGGTDRRRRQPDRLQHRAGRRRRGRRSIGNQITANRIFANNDPARPDIEGHAPVRRVELRQPAPTI